MSLSPHVEKAIVPTILASCQAAFSRVRREIEMRRAAKVLAGLDDRQLADFGMRRNAIEHAVRHGRSDAPLIPQRLA